MKDAEGHKQLRPNIQYELEGKGKEGMGEYKFKYETDGKGRICKVHADYLTLKSTYGESGRAGTPADPSDKEFILVNDERDKDALKEKGWTGNQIKGLFGCLCGLVSGGVPTGY
ncbi:hypothetical protein, partial [Bifidobacterium jacchi]